jgi:hypothetical protein
MSQSRIVYQLMANFVVTWCGNVEESRKPAKIDRPTGGQNYILSRTPNISAVSRKPGVSLSLQPMQSSPELPCAPILAPESVSLSDEIGRGSTAVVRQASLHGESVVAKVHVLALFGLL